MSEHLHIPIAALKTQLQRIDEILPEPVILIGGLAVQQYITARASADIDIVCPHEVSRAIIDVLYPTHTWDVQDENKDEYRPSFVIKHKVEKEYPIIHFGPKMASR